MERLLTAKEVAEYLRFREQTVVRKAERGEIPGIKVGNRWRFPQDQIERWVREGNTAETRNREEKKIKLEAYPLGVIGGLSRRDIYEDR